MTTIGEARERARLETSNLHNAVLNSRYPSAVLYRLEQAKRAVEAWSDLLMDTPREDGAPATQEEVTIGAVLNAEAQLARDDLWPDETVRSLEGQL